MRDMQDYTKFLIQGESNITEMVANAAVALEKENQKTEEYIFQACTCFQQVRKSL